MAVAAAGKRSWRDVIWHSLVLPTTIAVVIAALLRLADMAAPQPLERAIGLLGLQLAGIREFPRARLGLMGLAAFSQLILAPLLTLGLALALQISGVTLQALAIESAMPTAVITTILAVEYELDTTLVSGAVVLSTLLSPLTLTPWIAFLQRR